MPCWLSTQSTQACTKLKHIMLRTSESFLTTRERRHYRNKGSQQTSYLLRTKRPLALSISDVVICCSRTQACAEWLLATQCHLNSSGNLHFSEKAHCQRAFN